MIKTPCVMLWRKPSAQVDLRALVSPSESARAMAMGSSRRQDAYLRGRALLRWSLSELGIETPEVFSVNQNEKPFLSGGPHFNLSHSGDAVALALDNDFEVGLDVEDASVKRNFLSIVEEYGSLQEKSYLNSRSEDLKADTFYKIWSLKEAYCKATGEGLSENLVNLDFDVAKKMLHVPWLKLNASFYSLQTERLHLALCRLGPKAIPDFYEIREASGKLAVQELKDVHFEEFVVVVPGIAAHN